MRDRRRSRASARMLQAMSDSTRRTGDLSRRRVLAESLLFFGVPGVTILVCVHVLVPRLVDAGVPLLFAWAASVVGWRGCPRHR